MDSRLSHLRRQVMIDPDNIASRRDYYEMLACIYQEESLYVLLDRVLWNQASQEEQDCAIALITGKFHPDFSIESVSVYQCGHLQSRIATFKHRTSQISLSLLPGGIFQMGSGVGGEFERPLHDVEVAPFLLGQFLVRQSEWDRFKGQDMRHWKCGNLPIETVSRQAVDKWLVRAGNNIRLPSEAEWEYACRSGTSGNHFWDNLAKPGEQESVLDQYCWYLYNSDGRTHPSEHHAEFYNSFGLVDMLGNLFEWCSDDWIPHYWNGPVDSSPRRRGTEAIYVPQSGCYVGRGGCYESEPESCRAALRGSSNGRPSRRVGFRVAKSIPGLARL